MAPFLSIVPSKTFVQNVISIKDTTLPKISSKEEGKTFLVKIKIKLLCCYKP